MFLDVKVTGASPELHQHMSVGQGGTRPWGTTVTNVQETRPHPTDLLSPRETPSDLEFCRAEGQDDDLITTPTDSQPRDVPIQVLTRRCLIATTAQITHAQIAAPSTRPTPPWSASRSKIFASCSFHSVPMPTLRHPGPPLPDRVLVTTEAEEEEAITLIDHLFRPIWTPGPEDRDQVFSRGTRFDDENPAPIPAHHEEPRRTSDPSFMVLPDGRRVLQLDAQRLLTPVASKRCYPKEVRPGAFCTRRSRQMSLLPRFASDHSQSAQATPARASGTTSFAPGAKSAFRATIFGRMPIP